MHRHAERTLVLLDVCERERQLAGVRAQDHAPRSAVLQHHRQLRCVVVDLHEAVFADTASARGIRHITGPRCLRAGAAIRLFATAQQPVAQCFCSRHLLFAQDRLYAAAKVGKLLTPDRPPGVPWSSGPLDHFRSFLCSREGQPPRLPRLWKSACVRRGPEKQLASAF